MSKNLRNLLLICGIFPLTFSVTNTTSLTSKIEHTSKASILNYDSSLGIFKDLNKDEGKMFIEMENIDEQKNEKIISGENNNTNDLIEENNSDEEEIEIEEEVEVEVNE